MPHTTCAAIILALVLHAVGQDCSAQTRPEFPSGGPYTPGGVMSRNMELLPRGVYLLTLSQQGTTTVLPLVVH